MIEIRTTTPVETGEIVAVGIAWASSSLIRTRDLVDARVVRATPLLESRQRVAVCFAQEQHQAAALMSDPSAAA